MMQVWPAFQCLLLVVAANAAPVLVARLMGKTLIHPVDAGLVLPDGRRLLGPTKTLRGVAGALAATSLLGPAMGVPWPAGLAIGAAAMAGDLLSSFAKRRLGWPPSSRAAGLDQVPEALFPALAGTWLLELGLVDAIVVTAAFVAIDVSLSRVLCRLGLRRQPH
jgi:CDP-2,3-bis-(O-geranylgeranyl)-sn-glycerol synthase